MNEFLDGTKGRQRYFAKLMAIGPEQMDSLHWNKKLLKFLFTVLLIIWNILNAVNNYRTKNKIIGLEKLLALII